MALAIGSRLGPYEILAPLGAGGMGEVSALRWLRAAKQLKNLRRNVAQIGLELLSTLVRDRCASASGWTRGRVG